MVIEHYLQGGKLYFTPMNTDGSYGTEEEIGEVIDVVIGSNVTKAEAMSKDTGFSEVSEEVVTKKEYTLKYTTQNISNANLARAYHGTASTKTYVSGDTYHNGKTIATWAASTAYVTGDLVIDSGKIYEANNDHTSGTTTFADDIANWDEIGGATVDIITANTVSNVVGKHRFESAVVAGKKQTWTIPKTSVSSDGDFGLITDDFNSLTFSGKIQRVDSTTAPFTIHKEQ